MRAVKIMAAMLLLAALALAAVAYDAGRNHGRVMAWLLGRDRLVARCLPAVRTSLSGRGFSPTDVEVGDPVSIAVASGSLGGSRILSGPFTFSDGPNGPRVDGRLVCRIHGEDVEVDVAVDGLPLRAA